MAAGEAEAQAIGALTNKVQDHSSALQALQVSVEHVVRTTDRLYALAEKHGELAHELARLRDVVDRSQIDTKKGDDALLIAINNLTTTIREDRTASNTTADEVKLFKGAITGLRVALAVIVGLGGITGTLFMTNITDKITAVDIKTDDNRRVREAALQEQKQRTDGLEKQLFEVRLEQRQMRERGTP